MFNSNQTHYESETTSTLLSFSSALHPKPKPSTSPTMTMGSSKAIGDIFGETGRFWKELRRASAHGVSNGMIRMAQGGKFEHGFLAGFISSGVSSMHVSDNLLLNTAVAATVGGTTEAIGGGKFLNGAVTGAYVFLMNHEAHTPPDELINLMIATATDDLSKIGFECDLPYALLFIETVAEKIRRELSAYQTEDSCASVLPWDKNAESDSNIEHVNNGDGTYSYNGKKIVAQWHYGPAPRGYSTAPSWKDTMKDVRMNIYIIHMSNIRYYSFSPGPQAYNQCLLDIIPMGNPWYIPVPRAISKKHIKL